jgi:hypothetical protein
MEGKDYLIVVNNEDRDKLNKILDKLERGEIKIKYIE